MTCKLLEHKEAINNTKQFLVDTGGLRSMQSTEIADVAILRKGLKQLEQLSIQHYGVPGRPWLEDDNGTNVYPNGKVLAAIERVRKARGLYEGRFPGNYKPSEAEPVTPTEIVSNTRKYQKGYINDNLKESEFGIRDLAARLAARTGGVVIFESDLTEDYAGYNQGQLSVINLAKATLDTPIHEIVGHPIIRAIKQIPSSSLGFDENWETQGESYGLENKPSKEEIERRKEQAKVNQSLYQNLLKELETGYGKEVLDRVKKEYVNKSSLKKVYKEIYTNRWATEEVGGGETFYFNTKEEAENFIDSQLFPEDWVTPSNLEILETTENTVDPYTLEEQQEEALVQLVSEMVANKIKNTKENKNLIQLLKQLLKEMSDYMRSLFNKKELDIFKDLDNIDYLTNQKINELIKKGLIDKNCD